MKTMIMMAMLVIGHAANAQYNKENLSLDNEAIQNVYRFKNLQLFPIRASKAFVNQFRNLGKYVSLQEALEKEKVVITERAAESASAARTNNSSIGGTVNTLFIENVSSDTIMVLAGEVVQGGKQDRVIADDFLLYPKSGKKDLSVFCVEHGRWTSDDGNAVFEKYYNLSSNKVRRAAAVSKDQQQVWNEVEETTTKNGAGTSTGTLTALQQSGSLSKQLEDYTRFFAGSIGSETDVIGVVAVTGNTILGCDMFATHELFEKKYQNLINSYATEAITSGKEVNISFGEVRKYLETIIGDEKKQEQEVEKKGTQLKDGKRKLHISTF